jgi:uncharacterized protein
MNDHIEQQPQDYPYSFNADACSTCSGRCCRGNTGYVWITTDEIAAIAKSKQMELADFYAQYIRYVGNKLSLTERFINNEYLCCFFDAAKRACSIYEKRPRQCITFPFWDEFKDDKSNLIATCPGIVEKTISEN